jgi:hypothetical protein
MTDHPRPFPRLHRGHHRGNDSRLSRDIPRLVRFVGTKPVEVVGGQPFCISSATSLTHNSLLQNQSNSFTQSPSRSSYPWKGQEESFQEGLCVCPGALCQTKAMAWPLKATGWNDPDDLRTLETEGHRFLLPFFLLIIFSFKNQPNCVNQRGTYSRAQAHLFCQ